MNIRLKKLSQPLTLGLALIAGGGFILMAIALGMGALQGANAQTDVVSAIFVLGLTLLIFGFIGWMAAVRPWQNFDDINVPKDIAHHAHEPNEDHTLVVSGPHSVETHAETHS